MKKRYTSEVIVMSSSKLHLLSSHFFNLTECETKKGGLFTYLTYLFFRMNNAQS